MVLVFLRVIAFAGCQSRSLVEASMIQARARAKPMRVVLQLFGLCTAEMQIGASALSFTVETLLLDVEPILRHNNRPVDS